MRSSEPVKMGVFARIKRGLSEPGADPSALMMDATYLKAHRPASSLRVEKGGLGRPIGRTKGGLNTKLHALRARNGTLLRFFMSAGQVSDYTSAEALLSSFPAGDYLLADRGYDADWCRYALKYKVITPCIPGKNSRETPAKYHKRRYRRRSRIEMVFGRMKDWRRVTNRYDRCPKVFMNAIILAATVMFWL